MRQSIITAILLGVYAASSGFRASAAAIDQVDAAQQRRQADALASKSGEAAPEIYPGESSDVGEQSVLQLKPRRTHFEAMADEQLYYTDNMFLSDEDSRKSANVLLSTVQVALAPTAYPVGGGDFAPRVGYRHEWYNYNLIDSGSTIKAYDFSKGMIVTLHPNDFDFSAQTAFTDATWTKGDWTFAAGFDFRRLLTSCSYDEFYREYVPHWGVQRVFPVDRASVLTLGYEGDYRFTESEPITPSQPTYLNDRTDHSLIAAYTRTFGRHVAVQPYYRFTYTRFTAGPARNDSMHTLGAAFYWYFTPQISARIFMNYDMRRSSESGIANYEAFNTGLGLNLTFRF